MTVPTANALHVTNQCNDLIIFIDPKKYLAAPPVVSYSVAISALIRYSQDGNFGDFFGKQFTFPEINMKIFMNGKMCLSIRQVSGLWALLFIGLL